MDVFWGVIQVAGGLAFFLFGMNILSSGLEKASGGLMERVLAKMSGNIFVSVLFGALVTAAVQSSTATTVIVVGLCNAGLLKLRGAVGIIMGANIGTTITAQILRLAKIDTSSNSNFFISLLTPVNFSAVLALAGILIIMTAKKNKQKYKGEIFLGIAILFTGMINMQTAVAPLADWDGFKKIFNALENPILGVVTGAIVTVLTQSSAATVGILQAISGAGTGAITFASAFPIIMGTNIGTCSTPLVSSINSSKNAKRAAMLHFYFNLLGTVIFLIAIYLIQYTIGWSFWSKEFTTGDIANFHTIFNVVATLIFIPFAGLLEKLVCFTVRDKPGDEEDDKLSKEDLLDERFLLQPDVALARASEGVVQMGIYAQKNFAAVRTLFDNFDLKEAEKINEREQSIDRLEDRIGQYLIKLTGQSLNEQENRMTTTLLHLISEFERIGDYTINVMETAQTLYENEDRFSDRAMHELEVLCDAISEIIRLAIESAQTLDIKVLTSVEPLEEVVDRLVEELKAVHIERSKKGECNIETGVHFLDILTNVERISDHCSNIAVYLIALIDNRDNLKKHEYLDRLHKNGPEDYLRKIEEYSAKYSLA
ncbi:phosphate:Na+ symporter [Ruminococcaceae bacterium FB2012]|nr:phosphate:Na+ symporter [Ruminococcaceae bacterium FB2012]